MSDVGRRSSVVGSRYSPPMPQLLALASAALFGVADFIGGFAARRLTAWTVATWTQIFGIPVLIVGVLVVSSPDVMRSDIMWGALAGVIGLAGLALLYATLAAGKMSIVAPIIGAGAAVVPVIYAVAVGEQITAIQWAGIALALFAVVLLARVPGAGRLDRKLFLQALLTAMSFGVFFVIMGQTGQDSGVWPLVAARSVSIPIGVAVLLVSSVKPKTPRGSWLLVATSGVIDMAANIAILMAVQRGPIGINAVLGSLYPVFTVAAAVIVLRERPSRMQTAGIALAVLAIVALAV
jgi:drug/metabolite transporter (DMT)-like permease